MKSIFTFACFATLNLCAAQPVINSNHVSQNLDVELYFLEMPAGFTVGQSGPNRIWNYANLEDGMFLGTQQSVPVAGSPYASQFPNANYCYTMESAFMDITTYFYHSLTATKFEIWSLGLGDEIGEEFQNPRTYVTFPYTYNTVFTDTYQRHGDPAPIELTATYDAYGTLIMPFGTFQNVVRQKIVTEGNTDYVWFNVNPFYPILQTVFEDEALGYVLDHTVLGVEDAAVDAVSIYPNPARETLHFKMGNVTDVDVSISDLTGKRLISKSFSANDFAIDIEHLDAGIYLVKVSGPDLEYAGKIIKG